MNKYDDIINLPHHVSSTRRAMSMSGRAAQFAPFAALTGYEEAVNKSAHAAMTRQDSSLQELDDQI